jgi:NADPH-dependent dioxygenase
MDTDLLIIGAGPTGLTAAACALHLGLSVRIVDRKAHRSTFSKALVMHARTLEALDTLGLADRFVAAGAPFEALNVRFGGRRPVRIDLGALAWGDTRFPFWLSIPQYETERLLEEHLEELGGALEWETSLVDLEQDAAGVTARLQTRGGREQRATARWVVGADGGRSRTRELVSIPMERESLEQTYVLADARTTCDLAPAEGHVWHAEQGLLLIVPMPEPGVFRIIAHAPELGPGDAAPLDAAWFDALILERSGVAFGAHDLAWTSQFVLSQGLSAGYRGGRVFLAGDAAHVHSPVGGQGMNTGSRTFTTCCGSSRWPGTPARARSRGSNRTKRSGDPSPTGWSGAPVAPRRSSEPPAA